MSSSSRAGTCGPLVEVVGGSELARRALRTTPSRDWNHWLAQLVAQDEIGHVFAEVLTDAGVYKLDEAGRAGFVRFLESVK